MNKLIFKPIKDEDINFYLECRNLFLNRKFSLSKSKITKLDHYIWWFSEKNRKSHVVIKNKKKIAILTEQILVIDELKIIYTGFMSCYHNSDIIDLLKLIKWQNQRVSRHKNAVNIINVTKDNMFGNLHLKYFKFSKLSEENNLYKIIKKKIGLNKKYNTYYKVLN